MPATIRPPPAYIAASVASQIVTDHHNAQLGEDDGDDEPPTFLANALFSEQALRLLNAFLDHLLFSFLAASRSPSLTTIRPAIAEVLKPRLAREAMAAADEELQGLLAGEDDEEFPAGRNGPHPGQWDVEKVWKRTRLRIMVYTRLGEMEDEDEERFVLQERGLSMDTSDDDEAGLVSWAAAIFLTSVIEYVAEQTLMVSGQAALNRTSAKLKRDAPVSPDGEENPLERIVVEDYDVEKVALNAALGRLWRTWRKRVRSPITPLGPLSPPRTGPRSMASFTSLHRRGHSHDTINDSILSVDGPAIAELPEHQITETDIAANIPLPIGDNDVAEIEVPGLARQFDEASSGTQTPVARPQRPTSFIMLAPAESFKQNLARGRPLSMPAPELLPFTFPPPQSSADVADTADADEVTDEADAADATDAADEANFVTPMERMHGNDSYVYNEHQQADTGAADRVDPLDKTHPSQDVEADEDADMVAFAASTGMGFGMSPSSPAKPNAFEPEGADQPTTPTQSSYDGEPQVLQSKRMSIERSGPPGLVRTYSTRSNRSSLGAQTTAAKWHPEEAQESHDSDGYVEAIGVAKTSDLPIPTPSPPVELSTSESSTSQAKQPEAAVADQPAMRRIAASSSSVARKTPSPVDRPSPSEKILARKDLTPPRSSSASRVPALASLQESESWQNQVEDGPTAEKRSSDSHRAFSQNSSRQGGSRLSREVPIAVAERSVKRQSSDSVPHSRAGPADGVERSTLKRVSSTSTTRSVSTSILNSARESDSSLTRPRGLSGRMSEEDKAREFDSFVKSDETVKYTLTPQSMRDMDEPPIVVRKVESPKATSSVTVYPRVNADKDNSFGSRPIPARRASQNGGTSSANKKLVGGKPLAREPRIHTESMRDFADFIRSTGPSSQDRPVQPFVSLSNAKPAPKTAPVPASAGVQRKTSTKQTSGPTHMASGAGEGPLRGSRANMEPRSAAGRRSGNGDLIDFIRQGPPGGNSGEHKISRTIAPFRTTVDSDQFDDMLHEHGTVESAYGSQISTNSKQSTRTSTNSRTGLLPSNTVVQPAYSNTPQKLTGSLSSAPQPQKQITRYRNKDPYALDSDDEDDDLLTALPKSGMGREESLADFLNGAEPPVNNEPKPFLLDEATIAAAKARSANNGVPSSNASSSSSATANGNRSSGPNRRPGAQPAVISSSITSDAPRAYKPKLQARAAGARDAGGHGRSATNDLADFLRTSGPPEPPAPAPAPAPGSTIRKDEGKRISTKFWRKKTYPDMP